MDQNSTQAGQRRWLTIRMLEAQMKAAVTYGCLVTYSKRTPGVKGADWDDPTKFAPPDLGCN